jgi:hypothetical protein
VPKSSGGRASGDAVGGWIPRDQQTWGAGEEAALKGVHMAEMIPDRLPSGASAGERKVFALLQQLPDDIIVYYEPVVAERYPDFIVIIPSVGLLVIEVKGWYPNHILEATNAEVTIHSRGQREICKHPIRQARDYQHHLMNTARRHSETAALLQQEGIHSYFRLVT